jgi:hypothetical protein
LVGLFPFWGCCFSQLSGAAGSIDRNCRAIQQLDAQIQEQRQIKERGFLEVMWPQLLSFLVLLFLWMTFLRWYF